MKRAPVFIGTSGWYYNHWKDVLYPPGLAKAKRFEVYAVVFNSVEINATFYRLPNDRAVKGWYAKAPEGFMFAVKANRDITHNRSAVLSFGMPRGNAMKPITCFHRQVQGMSWWAKKSYPFVEKHTAGIACYRLHGPEQMCASSYSDAWLETLGDHIACLSYSGRKTYVFFNNDIGGYAVHNARFLKVCLRNGSMVVRTSYL